MLQLCWLESTNEVSGKPGAVHLTTDTPYGGRIVHTQDELLAWAEEERVQTLAEGLS